MKKKIRIEGMKCENCAIHVKEALNALEGVTGVDINLSDKYAVIETSKVVSDEAIMLAVNIEKYNVVGIEAI
jgi:copper chaperone